MGGTNLPCSIFRLGCTTAFGMLKSLKLQLLRKLVSGLSESKCTANMQKIPKWKHKRKQHKIVLGESHALGINRL